MTEDERQQWIDELIRETLAEIDADTIRRFGQGEHLIRTATGPEWVYVVDATGQPITDHDRLNALLGSLMY